MVGVKTKFESIYGKSGQAGKAFDSRSVVSLERDATGRNTGRVAGLNTVTSGHIVTKFNPITLNIESQTVGIEPIDESLRINQEPINSKFEEILGKLIQTNDTLIKVNKEKPISIHLLDNAQFDAHVSFKKDRHEIAISKALLKAAVDNFAAEDQGWDSLAFVIAHELSHIVFKNDPIISKKEREHRARAQVIVGVDPWSHFEENFCDNLPIEMMDKAGYNPKYAGFRIFGDARLRNERDAGLLESHPKLGRRHNKLQDSITNRYLDNYDETPKDKFTPEELAAINSPSKYQALISYPETRDKGPYSGSLESMFLKCISLIDEKGTDTSSLQGDQEKISEYISAYQFQDAGLAQFYLKDALEQTLKYIKYDDYNAQSKFKVFPQEYAANAADFIQDLLKAIPNLNTLKDAGFTNEDLLEKFYHALKGNIELMAANVSLTKSNLNQFIAINEEIDRKLFKPEGQGSLLARFYASDIEPIHLKLSLVKSSNIYDSLEQLISTKPKELAALIANLKKEDLLDLLKSSKAMREFCFKKPTTFPAPIYKAIAEELYKDVELNELLDFAETSKNISVLFLRILEKKINSTITSLTKDDANRIRSLALKLTKGEDEEDSKLLTILSRAGYQTYKEAKKIVANIYLSSFKVDLDAITLRDFAEFFNTCGRTSYDMYRKLDKDIKNKLDSLIAHADNKSLRGFMREIIFLFDDDFRIAIIDRYLKNSGLDMDAYSLSVLKYESPREVDLYRTTSSQYIKGTPEQAAFQAITEWQYFEPYKKSEDYLGGFDSELRSQCQEKSGNTFTVTDKDLKFLIENAPEFNRIVFLDILIDRMSKIDQLKNVNNIKTILSWIEKDDTVYPVRYKNQDLAEYFGPEITLYDYFFVKFFEKNWSIFRDMAPEKAYNWINDNYPKATPYRNNVVLNLFRDRLDSIDNLDLKVKIVGLLHGTLKGYELKAKVYQENVDKFPNLKQKLDFLVKIFDQATLQRDELIDEILNKQNCSFKEYKELVKPILSSSDYVVMKTQSLIDGSLKTVFNNFMGPDYKVHLLEWLLDPSAKPKDPYIFDLMKKDMGINMHDIRPLFMYDKQFRNEFLEEVFLESSHGLFHKDHITAYPDKFIDAIFKKHFDLASSNSKTEQLKRLSKSLLKQAMKLSNESKKMSLIKSIFDTFVEKINKKEAISIEDLLKATITGYGPIGDKLGQILASQVGIKQNYPELYEILQSVKSGKRVFSPTLAFAAIEKNPELINNYDVNLSPQLNSASLKSVFPAELKAKANPQISLDKVLKVKRPNVDKFITEEKVAFSEMMQLLGPVIAKEFGIKEIPDYSKRIFRALTEELDFKNEMEYSEEFSKVVESFVQQNPGGIKVNTPKQMKELAKSFMLVEDWAKGQTLSDWAQSANSRAKKKVNNRIMEFFIHQLASGLFHADQHSGNMIYDEASKELNYIDTGSCGRVDQKVIDAVKSEIDLKTVMKFVLNDKMNLIQKLMAAYKMAQTNLGRLSSFIAKQLNVEVKYIENIFSKIDIQSGDSVTLTILSELNKIPNFKVSESLDKLLLCLSKPMLAQ